MSYNDTVIFTINGFQGNMWSGPQANTGKALSDQGAHVAYWQPIGYNSGGFPLSVGVNSGLSALQTQFNVHLAGQGYPGEQPMKNILMSDWSEGSIIATLAYYNSVKGVPGWPSVSMWKARTTFGHPYRQLHKWAPNAAFPQFGPDFAPDPGADGIGGTRNNMGEGGNPQTPSFQADYAHPGDLYTNCPDDARGNAIRIIFDFVLTQFTGAFEDLWQFVLNLESNVLNEIGGITGAITIAVSFYSSGTAAHVNYDSTDSINYMLGVARTLGGKSLRPTRPKKT